MNSAISTAIGNINSFDMTVVQVLPTENISTHTIYLVPKTGETNDVYDEYVYINDAWEMVGNTQIDLSNYVQKTDYATSGKAGVVKINAAGGIGINKNSHALGIFPSSETDIKNGTEFNRPIVPYYQHTSTFYGLAKAAGDTTQSQSENAVGTYTDEAKAAIQQMLDVPSTGDIPDTSIYAEKTEVPVESGTGVGSVQTKEYIYSNVTYTQNASARGSIAIGGNTTASGINSFAEGGGTIASGTGAHAEGDNTTASSGYAHAEGSSTTASASYAHAEGWRTAASATGTHTEGRETSAAASYSHAEGRNTSVLASGKYAHSEGQGTISAGQSSHVSGEYNVEDNYDDWPRWSSNTAYAVGDKVKIAQSTSTRDYYVGYICKEANNDNIFDNSKWIAHNEKMNYAHIVGNGTADNARSNAYALDWDGNGHYAGDVYVHANADSTGGTKLATIEDIPDAPVQDVQINGVSVLTDRVANLPMITSTSPGIAKVDQYSAYGINVRADGTLQVVTASDAQIKSGSIGNDRRPITPANQHSSIFYGLAKLAGADMKNVTGEIVGTYPDAQKTAIKRMLGVEEGLKVVRLI